MFKFDELKEIHLEITSRCQASCPMCARNRQGGLDNPLLKDANWTLGEFKHIMSPEVLNQIEGFFFCGNFGDPILNHDLVEMCKYASGVNPSLNMRVHTNGSARPVKWWKDLVAALPQTHNIVFALDGLADTHHLYRIGTSFDTVIRNATAVIEAGGTAEWCFIRFKHNEHQLDEAREMANRLGFKGFVVKNSSRFLLEPKVTVLDRSGNPTHVLEPPTDVPLKFIDKKVVQEYKAIVAASKIDCQSFNQREVYIDANRHVFPCCWLASLPYTYVEPDNDATAVRHEMLTQYCELVREFGTIDDLDAGLSGVKQIVNSYAYQNVWKEYWTTKKLITCARMCGVAEVSTFAKSRDQVVRDV